MPRTVQPIACASWTAAEPTPLPTAWTRTRSPGRTPAWVSSASCAVRKTSGTAAACLEVEVGGDRHGHPLVGDDVLGLASAANDPEDAVADPERPGHIRPERLDLARELQPRDVGRRLPAARGSTPGTASGRPGSTRTPARGPGPGPPEAPAWERPGFPAPRARRAW